jgi:methyl-accepting chemotaxis protein
MFRNIKIGARLAVGFGMAFLLMIVLIGIGLARFQSVSDVIEANTVSWTRADAAYALKVSTEATLGQVKGLFISSSEANIEGIAKAIAGEAAVTNVALDKLDKLVVDDEGKALIAKMRSVRAPWVAARKEVDRLIRAGQREEATALMLERGIPAMRTFLGSQQNLLDYEKERMNVGNAKAAADIRSAQILISSLGAAVILLGIMFAFVVTRSITRPIRDAVKVAQTVASGNLTSRIIVSSKDETGQLMFALKEMNDSLARTVSGVQAAAGSIAVAAAEISAGNNDLSQRTEEQASSLEETASSMEELTATVKQNSGNARQATQLAMSASDEAAKGGDVVTQVVTTMRAISDGSKKMGDIISIIEGIAFQTNILALNAAVEAARAGEQGRGFAVVASEVRNLAQRSAAAAKDIKDLINASVSNVDEGSQLVDRAGKTMEEIVKAIKRVTDVMGEISASSDEQSAGIEQVNQAIGQMDRVTQQNASLVEEAASAAASLQDQGEQLRQAVSVFRVDGALQPENAERPSGISQMTSQRVSGEFPARRMVAAAKNLPSGLPNRRNLKLSDRS